MAINNFKPFALDPNANVTSQADWEALPALLSGFTAGKASSAQVNKAIRQASFIAAALAQYTANKSGLDVLDDGDLNGFISKMGTAFGKDFQALDATLSALAGLATGANKLPYFTGNDTAAQTDLTSVGRDIIGKNTIADILTYLQLGEAAKLDAPEFTFSGYSFIAKFPGKTGGSDSPLIIQGTQVTIPRASAGGISTIDVMWPSAFPTSCNFVQVSSGGITFSPDSSPFFGVTPVDRTKCTASSTYTLSPAAAFVMGVGY